MVFVVVQKESQHGLLVVVTDKEILGKKFEEGKKQLDLGKKFYQGEEMEKEEVKKWFLQARHLHLTGTRTIALALGEDLISTQNILWVQGVPHVEIVME